MKLLKFNSIYFIMILILLNITKTLQNQNYDIRGLLRKKRYLVYPNPLDSETKVQVLFGLGLPMESTVSTILGYVLKCNYNLPYNATTLTQPYVRYQRNIHKKDRYMTRWSLYRLLESSMQVFGNGRVCLLRAVCEASETPFEQRHGLIGEILNVIFKPSRTSEDVEYHDDHEFLRAEFIGKKSKNLCARVFHECEKSLFDYFTFIQ